ncbi:hypothetical protein O3S80_49980 [Streptomyces sp. Lzd4kr]|nr:hypothetical protein [Streptomyces sp. Lzd4kr]
MLLASPTSASATLAPFTEPSFTESCTWHHFEEGEWPPPWLWLYDPLCVEYDKRDITTDNGGALRFLLAEPSRFAVALVSCRYYQKDHWSVQTTTGSTPFVAWDGQYWFDKRARTAAIRLTNFRIAGHSAGVGDVVDALRPDYPELAGALAEYGDELGETGMTVTLPYDLTCSLTG